MSGLNLPNGYSLLADTIYSNSDDLIKSLKDGKDYVKVTVVDSRGNTSSSSKPLNVEIFRTPYFNNIESRRLNDVDEQVELKATGKLTYLGEYDVKYIKYWSSETPYNEYGENQGTEYGPFYIDISKITYNENKSEFSIESLIEGDLGASGFTKGKMFYIKLAIATSINLDFPEYFYTTVQDGKYLIIFGPDGIKFDSEGTVNSDTLPIGFEGYYPSANPPSNWLIEDGRAVSRTEYKELFDVIGTTYGNGDGSTTFNLPNKKGKIVVSYDSSQSEFNTLGKIGGSKTHTLTVDQIPNHNHNVNSRGTEGNIAASGTAIGSEFLGMQNKGYSTTYTGGSQAHNNLQPYLVQYSIIKAKNSVPISSVVVDRFDSTSSTDALSVNKGTELYNLVKERIVYSFPIFGIAGDTPVSVTRAEWKDLGNIFYNYKPGVNTVPVPTGYTRYARCFAILTDNCNNTSVPGIQIGLFNQSGGYHGYSFTFDIVWGAINNARLNRMSTNRIAFNSLPNEWTVFKGIITNTQTGANGEPQGQIRYVELQFVDIKN